MAVLFHNQKKTQGYNYGEDEGSNHFFLTLFPESDLDTRESTRKPVAPKYKNNTTGETWSGRGKPPKWMAGHDKSLYLIK